MKNELEKALVAIRTLPREKAPAFLEQRIRAAMRQESQPVELEIRRPWAVRAAFAALALAVVAGAVLNSPLKNYFRNLSHSKTVNHETDNLKKEDSMRISTIALGVGLSVAAIQAVEAPEAKADSGAAPDKIAAEYGISQDSVNFLKATYKIGYGGVSKALALSQKTGLSAEEILRMKTEEKMGWGKIEQELGTKKNKGAEEANPQREEKMLEKQERKQLKAEEKAEKKAEKAERKTTKEK